MTPDNELIRQYAQARSEEAFAELVRRHVNLVYSAALRVVGGDAHLAQDVAQTVFTDLARKARLLSGRESLAGWLYTSACFAAGKIVRTETRRREREEKFMREPAQDTTSDTEWEKLRPALDSVMHELKETDREAILLRYFENRPFAEVGAQLGIGENGARMRVERAVEKMRARLARRGIATAAALTSVLSAHAVQTAPAHLATTLASFSMANVTAGAGTFGFLKFMTATQLKFVVGALIFGGAATGLVIQHQSQARLQRENEILRKQLTQSQAADQALSLAATQTTATADSPSNQTAEVLKLRAEITALRQQNQAGNHAQPNSHSTRLIQPDSKVPAVLEAPTVALSPSTSWANLGSASPEAAMQTLYWAMSRHDQNAFSSLVAWDADAQTKLQALFAAAPDSVQQRFGSVDGVLYALLSAVPPIDGFAVVSQTVQGEDDILVEQHRYQDGRVRQNQVTLHHFDDGWRLVFGDEKLMRGFDALLKRAAMNAPQSRP
jgi:RNA polymerase sigma factor (sigma-70 family)